LAEFGFKPKPAHLKPKTYFSKKLPKKEPLLAPRNGNHKPDRNKCIGSFEPSNILYTRSSDFWRLRNLNAWFKEQESYEDSRYLKPHSIEI